MDARDDSINLPPGYPAEWTEQVPLRDGARVTIRPILPRDAPLLQEGFTRLSAQSIYYRFLESARQLSDEQAQRLANLDYQDRMALVAVIEEQGIERLVGVARYAFSPEHGPGAAETAVVVRDDYHGRGLGTILYKRLILYAQQHGVTTFIGTIHQSNNVVMKFIRKSGLPFEREMIEPGTFLVKIHLNG
ncbi:MAG: GNAT family N-acetyltransferase [Anaerolineales bacterium]|jgi:acetyltransferase|nr:GNAT family N-acetyltransferase [Anaerolineales bacterium]